MNTRYAVSRTEFERMTTQELRGAFVVESVFKPGEMPLVYWENDRTVVGGAMPTTTPLKLEAGRELAAEYFLQRRELGVINVGGPGTVTADGVSHDVGRLACLYVGRGTRDVAFASRDVKEPAKFFLISYPAHAAHPTTLATQADANRLDLGSQETANQRTIYQCVHEKGIQSCQLVMGYTQLAPGSVWNTMPPHTHARRSEVYLYFDVADDAAVFHFMGPGDQTRNVLLYGGDAVLSPIWSVHSGCGTRNYSFIWAMGGENQRFDDMDGIAVRDLR